MKLGQTCKAGHLVAGDNSRKRHDRNNYYECRTCEREGRLARYYATRVLKGHGKRQPASAWCAPELVKEYTRLCKKMPAAQAKPLVLAMMADAEKSRRAAMTPFERQMDAVRRGVGLVGRFDPVRSYDRTLGGVSSI